MDQDNQVLEDSASSTVENAPEEKLVPQSQVNKLIGSAKEKAAEAARREVEQKYQRELEALNAQRSSPTKNEGSAEIDEDALYQKFTQRLQNQMQEENMKNHITRIGNTYSSKIEQGKSAYEDFDEVTKDYDPAQSAHLTVLLSDIDNPADVLYEINSNPTKLVVLDQLARTMPKKAMSELLKISKSISDNKQAQAEASSSRISDPLDRLSPSKVSGSNGKMSITDLRSQPWMRG